MNEFEFKTIIYSEVQEQRMKEYFLEGWFIYFSFAVYNEYYITLGKKLK